MIEYQERERVGLTIVKDATVVVQEFERGRMYWFAPEEPEANGTIFALMDDSEQWFRAEDTWDGISKSGVQPPPGRVTPGGGFGKAWWENHFEIIIGFAVSGEEVMNGHYAAWQDGWELFIGALVLQLRGSDEWVRPVPSPGPSPDPSPIPIPVPVPAPEPRPDLWWVWLNELDMALNLDHVVWIGADRLRIGSHDIVLALPEQTAAALRAYVKARCVEII